MQVDLCLALELSGKLLMNDHNFTALLTNVVIEEIQGYV